MMVLIIWEVLTFGEVLSGFIFSNYNFLQKGAYPHILTTAPCTYSLGYVGTLGASLLPDASRA